MVHLQSPNPVQRIYQDFTGIPDGPLPTGWMYRRTIGGATPEIYADHIRMGPTTVVNTNNQAFVGYTGKPVLSDNQVVRGVTRSALNGLRAGICMKMDAAMENGVLFMMTTNDSDVGIWTISSGVGSRRATIAPTSTAVGDTWMMKNDGDVYTVVRNPYPDNSGGTTLATWTDSAKIVKSGADYRYGGFYVNSDRNALGAQNWGAGLDFFDFRDLKWTWD